uniref:BESS domain-containing protein n=1 Tax=Panagrellus redivivus TaxID=6233 RepID=A0A7E4ZTU5_PANRE
MPRLGTTPPMPAVTCVCQEFRGSRLQSRPPNQMTLEFTDLPVFAKPDDFFELSSRLYNHADTFTVSQRHQLRPILESIIIKFESTMYLRPILKNLLRFLDEEIMPYCTDDYYYQPDDVSDYGTESESSMPEPMTVIEEVEDEEDYEEDYGIKEPYLHMTNVEMEPPRMRRSAPLNFDTLSVVSECPSLLSNSLEEKVVPAAVSSEVIELPIDDSAPLTSTCSSSLPPSPLPSPNPSDQLVIVKNVDSPAPVPLKTLKPSESEESIHSNFIDASGDHAPIFSMIDAHEDEVDVEVDFEPEPLVKKRSFRKNVSRLVHRVSKVFRSKHKIDSEVPFSSS